MRPPYTRKHWPSDLFENFYFGLCLGSPIGIVSPAIDESLQVLAVVHLRLVLLEEISVALRLGRVELREVPEVPVVKGQFSKMGGLSYPL